MQTNLEIKQNKAKVQKSSEFSELISSKKQHLTFFGIHQRQLHNVLVSGTLLQYIMSILQNQGVHLFIL